jgi:HlyD family secretion protein
MKKKRIFSVFVVVALVCAVVAVATTRAQPSTSTTAAETGTVTQATLSAVVESSGSASPVASVTRAFGTSGTVSKVNVQVGDKVKQGDVLAELDTTDLELAVAQAEQSYLSQQATYSMTINPDPAEVTAAQLALSNASANYKLAQQKYQVNSTDSVALSCNGIDSAKQAYDDAVNAYNAYVSNWRVQVNGTADISQQKSQLDRAAAAYDQALANCNLTKSSLNTSGLISANAAVVQAKANLDTLLNPSTRTITAAKIQLEQARVAFEQAQQTLTDAQIVAPFDGIVTAVTAVIGGSGGSATIKLNDVSQYHVDVLIDETEIGQVQAGQLATITFDALPDAKVTGKVTRVDPAGTVSNGVVNYKARIELDPTEAALRTDMTANVSIVIDTHTNVLAVPGTAIRTDSTGYYVNVVGTDGTAQRVDIKTGYTDGTLTEISGDVQVGQRVYLGELTTTTTTQQRGINLFGLRIGG